MNKDKNHKKNISGFTLTELLVVTSLIVALIVIGLVYLRSQTFKGVDARRKSEMRRIGIAVEEYEKDNDCYPLSNQVICDPGNGLSPYLDKIPCDPETKASYFYIHEDSSCPKWYKLYSNLTNQTDVDYTPGIGPGGAFSYINSSPNSPTEVVQPTPQGGGGGGGGIPQADFYGCFSGVCTQISWDTSRPGPECDPNFQNSACYGQCVMPGTECLPWNQ